MPYSAIPNSAFPQAVLLSRDTFIYIGATGSDTADGTTREKAVATLKRAWEIAKTYTIVGDATLYIQFNKGIYNYTYDSGNTASNPFPNILYHPQGRNIVIQGDLDAIKQRYVWQVKDYSWDLSRWSYFGHTGTVNTWFSGPTHGGNSAASGWAEGSASGSGTTAHGFTAEDEGGYVYIGNVGLDTNPYYGYRDIGNGVADYKYILQNNHNYGRYCFNHGLSYEDAYAIVGLARIEGASADPGNLFLQFKYQNLDGRVHTYPGNTTVDGRIRGGLGNGLSYGIIDSNYPEPQYCVPNGYYGPTFGVGVSGEIHTPNTNANSALGGGSNAPNYGWDTGSSVNISYPARPSGVNHVTDDPHLLTSYPVVIKTTPIGANAYSRQAVPLVLSNCEIKAIRNLMFVNTDSEGVSWGNKSQIQGFDQNFHVGTAINEYKYSDCGLYMDNDSKTTIRHLGFYGYGSGLGRPAVYVNNSILNMDRGLDPIAFSAGANAAFTQFEYYANANTVYARLGKLSNTPILVSSHGGPIVFEGAGTFVDFSSRDSYAVKKISATQCISPVWIQASSGGGVLFAADRSSIKLGSTHLMNTGYPPGFVRMRFEIPVFAGATLPTATGATGAFYIPEVLAASRGNRYKSIVAYKNSGGTRVPIARFFDFINAPGYVTYDALGWTGAAWSGGTGALTTYTPRPVYTQTVQAYGLRLNQAGFDSSSAVRTWMGIAGNTLEFFAYKDHVEGTTVENEYLGISSKGILMGTSGGYSLAGVCTAYNYGYTLSDAMSLYVYQSTAYNLWCAGNASVNVQGVLNITGRSSIPIDVNQGKVIVNGSVFARDYSHSGILVDSLTSYFNAANIFIKHPIGYGWGGGDNPNDLFDYNYGLLARYGGQMFLGYSIMDNAGVYGDVVVAGQPVANYATMNEDGWYRGFGSTGAINNPLNTTSNRTPVICMYNSSINSVDNQYVSAVALQDGGSGTEVTPAAKDITKVSVTSNGYLNDPRIWSVVWNPSQGSVSGTQINIPIMTRGAYGTAAGQQLLYNAPRGATMWWHWDRNYYTRTRNAWVGPNNTPSNTQNTLYRRDMGWISSRINPVDSGVPTSTIYGATTQLGVSGAAWNNTTSPGYSGNAFYHDGSATIQPFYVAP